MFEVYDVTGRKLIENLWRNTVPQTEWSMYAPVNISLSITMSMVSNQEIDNNCSVKFRYDYKIVECYYYLTVNYKVIIVEYYDRVLFSTIIVEC